MTTFAEKLRTARHHVGISQEAAAQRTGVSHSTWAKWEQGKQRPTIDRLARIAEVVNVKPGDLL